jgi:uncharacterized membrane protein
MLLLVLGLVLFLGAHSLPMATGLHGRLVAALGEGPVKGLVSLASLAGVVLIVWGFGRYRSAGMIPVWDPPTALRHLTVLLMLPAMICLAASGSPGRIRQAVKHPQLTAAKIWAFAHLLANGDLGSMVLFGAFLAWAVADRISVKRRGLGPPPLDPAKAVRADIVTAVAGIVLWGGMIALHPILIGVPVIG